MVDVNDFFLATLCGAPRGQKDIAKFARGLSQAQRRALGIRRNRQGKYPVPTQPTFCRLLQRVDARKVEEAILAIQEQMRGPAPKDQLIALDGKEPRHGSGALVLTAVSVKPAVAGCPGRVELEFALCPFLPWNMVGTWYRVDPGDKVWVTRTPLRSP